MHIRVWIPPLWIINLAKAIAVGSLAAVAFAAIALAAGTTIPQRQARVCEQLGMSIGCVPKRIGRAHVTLIASVSDTPYEPGGAGPAQRPSAFVLVTLRNVTFSTIYQADEDRSVCLWPDCYLLHEQWPEYTGPNEIALTNLDRTRDKLLWQYAEPALALKLQSLTGSLGLPVITKVTNIHIDDQTTTPLATTIRAKTIVDFLVTP